MRARTSSPRLVSCVESVVCDAGNTACRRSCRAWNSATSIENSDGSPPTSVSDASRE